MMVLMEMTVNELADDGDDRRHWIMMILSVMTVDKRTMMELTAMRGVDDDGGANGSE